MFFLQQMTGSYLQVTFWISHNTSQLLSVMRQSRGGGALLSFKPTNRFPSQNCWGFSWDIGFIFEILSKDLSVQVLHCYIIDFAVPCVGEKTRVLPGRVRWGWCQRRLYSSLGPDDLILSTPLNPQAQYFSPSEEHWACLWKSYISTTNGEFVTGMVSL